MNASGGASYLNASGPCGATQALCLNGGACVAGLPEQPEPEPELVDGASSWIVEELPAAAAEQGRCSCPQGWAGASCEQLDLFRADVVYASTGVALLLCLLCCMAKGDPERRRIAIREREEGYRSHKLSDGDDSGCCGRCANIFEGMMDSLAALPLRWKIAWGVGSVLAFGLSVTILVVVPGSFVIILGLWTACIVRVGSQYSGSLLDTAGDEGGAASDFELATFTAQDIVARDGLNASLLHSGGGGSEAPAPAWSREHSMSGHRRGGSGPSWQQKVKDSKKGTRAESAAFSSF
jgi:hypothetical protein